MKARAKRIDNGEVVEGYHVNLINSKDVIFLGGFLEEYIKIYPQTLEYSFNGTDWYSEEYLIEAVEFAKNSIKKELNND
jgi:hypothetical protein